MGVSQWIWCTCLPWLWDRVKSSLPRTFLPKRLTVLVSTFKISSSASQSPDLRSRRLAPIMGISTLLRHLYLSKVLLGVIHVEILHIWKIFSASSFLMKLLGLLYQLSRLSLFH